MPDTQRSYAPRKRITFTGLEVMALLTASSEAADQTETEGGGVGVLHPHLESGRAKLAVAGAKMWMEARDAR